MGRKKIQIEYIDNEKIRRSTFLKRKYGVFKKVIELNRLTGAKVWLKIYDTREQQIEEYCSEGDRAIFDNIEHFDQQQQRQQQEVTLPTSEDHNEEVIVEEFREFGGGDVGVAQSQDEVAFKEALKRKVDSLSMSQLMTLANPLLLSQRDQTNLNTTKLALGTQQFEQNNQMNFQNNMPAQIQQIGQKRQRTEDQQGAWPALRSLDRLPYVQKQWSSTELEQISELNTPNFPSARSDSLHDLESDDDDDEIAELNYPGIQTRKIQQDVTMNKRQDKQNRKCMVSINLKAGDKSTQQQEPVQNRQPACVVNNQLKQLDLIGQTQGPLKKITTAIGPQYPMKQFIVPQNQFGKMNLRVNTPAQGMQAGNFGKVDQTFQQNNLNCVSSQANNGLQQIHIDNNQRLQKLQQPPITMADKKIAPRILIQSDRSHRYVAKLPQGMVGGTQRFMAPSNYVGVNQNRNNVFVQSSQQAITSGSSKMPAVPQGKTTNNVQSTILMQPQQVNKVYSLNDVAKLT